MTGAKGKVSHVPRPVMRAMSIVMRPVNPSLAGLITAGLVMDTRDMTFDPTDINNRYPSIPLTVWRMLYGGTI